MSAWNDLSKHSRRREANDRTGRAASIWPLMRESAARPLVTVRNAGRSTKSHPLAKNNIIANQIDHDVTDVFRSLRAQVLRRLGKNGVSTLGVTSLGHGEGKTTLGDQPCNRHFDGHQPDGLAGRCGSADPERCKVSRTRVKAGLADVLAGRATISECLINPGLQRLCILPARDSIDNSAELLSSPQMLQLVHEVKSRYTGQDHHFRSAAFDDGRRYDRISAHRRFMPACRPRRRR